MQKKSWTLYLVRNNLDNLYCGICTDLSRRFSEHTSGSKRCAKALKGKGPLVLEFAAYLPDHSTALKQEYWLKRQPRSYKLSLLTGATKLPLSTKRYAASVLQKINAQAYPAQ